MPSAKCRPFSVAAFAFKTMWRSGEISRDNLKNIYYLVTLCRILREERLHKMNFMPIFFLFITRVPEPFNSHKTLLSDGNLHKPDLYGMPYSLENP